MQGKLLRNRAGYLITTKNPNTGISTSSIRKITHSPKMIISVAIRICSCLVGVAAILLWFKL